MASEEEQHDIVIVGGGIAGLATALALHRKGIQSLVLEKSHNLCGSGAAISIFINGWRALDQLGLATELQRKTTPILEMHNALVDQKRIQVTPSRDEEFRCLRRSDLLGALANGVPAKSIRFGCQVAAVGTDPLTSFPVVHLNDGTTIKAKVLIGCDGLNSVVAKSLGLEAPRLFPVFAVRGLTNYPNGHKYGSNAFRIRAHEVIFGRYPVNSKLVYWFTGRQNRPTDSEVAKDPRRIRDFSLEILKGFPTDVIEMVEHCDLDSISFTHIRYQAPWSILFANIQRGTVTIAGDAMHAMGPFLAQGGNSGLEDAVVLARCLTRELNTGLGFEINDPEFKKRAVIALKDYVRERRPRVMRLSTQSYLTGSMLTAKSWAKRVLCLFFLVAFFGGMSLSHTQYNCGPL